MMPFILFGWTTSYYNLPKNINNQKGMALLTVILIFLVLITILAGVMNYATVNQRNSQTSSKFTTAYYTAESGLNLQVAKFDELLQLAKTNNSTITQVNDAINNLVNSINNNNNTVPLSSSLGDSNVATVSVTGPTSSTIGGKVYTVYRITSVGTLAGVSRSVYQDVGYYYVLGSGTLNNISGAVITQGAITQSHGTITGDIASNLINNSKINLDTCPIPTGTDTLNISVFKNNYTASDLNICNNQLNTPYLNEIIFSPIILPSYPDVANLQQVTIKNNTITLPSLNTYPTKTGFYINSLTPSSSLTIKLNGASDKELIYLKVVGSFSINSKITVTGLGRLLVLVNFNQNLKINGNVNENGTDPTKYLLVLKRPNTSTNKTLEVSNGIKFVGSIMSDSTGDFKWQQVSYYGFLVTNASLIDIQSGSVFGSATRPIWIYAPNAKVSIGSEGTGIFGSVMSSSINMTGNNSFLTYTGMNIDYPFEAWTPLPYIENGTATQSDLQMSYYPIIEQ